MEPIQNQSGLELSLFHALVDELERRRGLVKPYGSSYTYEITPAGILYAEDNRLIPAEVAEKHRKFRADILAFLAPRCDWLDDFLDRTMLGLYDQLLAKTGSHSQAARLLRTDRVSLYQRVERARRRILNSRA